MLFNESNESWTTRQQGRSETGHSGVTTHVTKRLPHRSEHMARSQILCVICPVSAAAAECHQMFNHLTNTPHASTQSNSTNIGHHNMAPGGGF